MPRYQYSGNNSGFTNNKNYQQKYRRMKKKYRKRKGETGSYWNTAYKAYRLASKVASLVNAEHKYYDTQSGFQSDYNGTLNSLVPIPQGDTQSTRDGDSLKIRNLDLRLQMNSVTSASHVRMVVFIDKLNTITAASDMYEDAGSVFAHLSQKKHMNRYDTVVLFDKTYTLNAPAVDDNSNIFKLNIPVNRHVTYEPATTNITAGNLKLLIISDQAPAGAARPSTSFNARVWYIDN